MESVRFLLVVIACATCAACSPGPRALAPQRVDLAAACGSKVGWSDPAPPTHVFGNTYMVGTCGITALLITTPKGHFLIDGATREAAPFIARNIEQLGFRLADVRYLLATHEHYDHVGGLAELQRLTGAKFVTRAAAQTAMATGSPDASDPQHGLIESFAGVRVDQVIEDGEKIAIGDTAVTLVASSGHAPGGSSWTWRTCEGATCHTLVYADSLNAVSADSYRFTDHTTYVEILSSTIRRIAALPCDILVSPHPFQSNLFERIAGREPLVDETGCARYAAAAETRLRDRLAKEAASRP